MNVNRFTQVTPSEFNPLSMEEIFMVPLSKQKAHDATQAQLDELGLFDLNRLSEDEDTAMEFIESYRNSVDSEIDNIMSKGITNQSKRAVRNLLNEKNKWLANDGEGGKMEANYNAFNEYKQSLDKAMQDGKLGLSRYNALLQQARLPYEGGVRAGGKLNMENAVDRVDIAKELQPFAKDMMSNPIKISELTGFKYDPNSGMFVNVKTNTDYHLKDAVKIALGNLVKTNPGMMSYLNQRNRLGLTPDINKHIDNITGTMDAMYSVTQQDKSIQGRYAPEYMSGNNPNNPDTPNNNVFSYKHNTRAIFDDTRPNAIVGNYTQLINSDSPEDNYRGEVMKAHYQRASNQFNSMFPELKEKYDLVETPVEDQLKNKFGINQPIINNPNIKFKDVNGGYAIYNTQTNQEYGKMSTQEYENLQKEKWKVFDEQSEYRNAFQNYLKDYGDETQSFILTNLKSSDGTTINRDISNIMRSVPMGNISVKGGSFDGKMFNNDTKKSEEILNQIKSNNYKIELLSFTIQNENGLPEMKIALDGKKEENGNGTIDVELDDTFTPGTLSKHVEDYVMTAFETYGGQEGRAIAKRGRDNIKYKNIRPSTQPTFKQSSNIKSIINDKLLNSISNKTDKNYEMDIQTNNTPNGNLEYTLQIKDDNGNQSSLTWGNLFENLEEFDNNATDAIQDHILNEAIQMYQKPASQITPEEFEFLLENLINNNQVIKANDYKQLLNILN